VVLSVTPASFTTKTGGHDIAEILLKVTLNTIKSNQSTAPFFVIYKAVTNPRRIGVRLV
jgi:hypothetical protein